MFTTATFLSFLAANAAVVVIPAHPASLTTSRDAPLQFDITNFLITAEASPSTSATYSFTVSDKSATKSSFSADCFACTESSPGLANVPSTWCDDAETVYFDFSNNGTGYVLDIVHLWGEDVQHAIVLAHNDFTDFGSAFFLNSALVNAGTVGEQFLASIESSGYFNVRFDRQD